MSSKKNVKRKKHTKKQKMYALAGLIFVVVALIIFLSIAMSESLGEISTYSQTSPLPLSRSTS